MSTDSCTEFCREGLAARGEAARTPPSNDCLEKESLRTGAELFDAIVDRVPIAGCEGLNPLDVMVDMGGLSPGVAPFSFSCLFR